MFLLAAFLYTCLAAHASHAPAEKHTIFLPDLNLSTGLCMHADCVYLQTPKPQTQFLNARTSSCHVVLPSAGVLTFNPYLQGFGV